MLSFQFNVVIQDLLHSFSYLVVLSALSFCGHSLSLHTSLLFGQRNRSTDTRIHYVTNVSFCSAFISMTDQSDVTSLSKITLACSFVRVKRST